MLYCKNCLLTDKYPFITIDEKGICNYCNSTVDYTYKGAESLNEQLYKIKNECKNDTYDCLIGLSGGRDSSYMAIKATQEWKLRPLGYCYDNGHMPEATRKNVEKISDKLNFKILIFNEDVKKNRELFKKIFLAWIKHPHLGMIQTFCIGCRGGIQKTIPKLYKKYNIRYILEGANNYENTSYKLGLFDINDNSYEAFMGGYKMLHVKLFFAILKEFVLNPHYITPSIVSSGFDDFIHGFGANIDKIRPFQYERYDPSKILDVITTKLDWQKEDYFPDPWRSDCDIALIKNYIYFKKLGFSDFNPFLSSMIRDKAIDRSTAESMLLQVNEKLVNSKTKITDLLKNYDIDSKSIQKLYEVLEA